MKTQILSLFLCMLCCFLIEAQESDLERDAAIYSNALLEGDFEKMVQYTYEGLIEKAGGPFYIAQEYVDDYNARVDLESKHQGVQVVVESEPIVYKGELQVIVLQEFTTNFKNQKFHTYDNLLGISTNKGLDWKFVDLSRHDKESLQDFLPNLSPDLEFPAMKEAVLLEKK